MAQFRNLVFEGGGVKGTAYAGALAVLAEEKILADIERVAGTSAGAVVAALVALGATPKELGDIIGDTNFESFLDDSFGLLPEATRVFTNYGWYEGEKFAEWMQELIGRYTGQPALTFEQLAALQAEQPDQYRRLYVVGTNLSQRMPQVYSAERTPEMPVWQAVRISMSIPLLFAAVFRPEGICVDGGVVRNYPLDIFDDRRYIDGGRQAYRIPDHTRYNEDHVYNKETLGFRVDTKDEIKASKERWGQQYEDIEGVTDFVETVLRLVLDLVNKIHLQESDWHRTVFIDAGGVRAIEFGLSSEAKQMLIENGRQGTRDYLAWFNDPDESPLNRIEADL